MTDRFLPTGLRRALEKTVKAAREVAEEGAADAVRRLGVADASAPAHLDDDSKALRRRLRAHARTLGDMATADGVHEVRHLVEATGYAQWHRRLFARFLAERGLLRHPEHGPVTLEDCEELAKLEDLADAWAAAESYGAKMLPGVFLPDDPVLALELAPEHAHALRRLVDDLDAAIFQADDSLGWTYQFWRAAEKDRINKAGGKIGAAELPAVTQLFTEPYMVRFLLHNTLGAWWAGKLLAARPDLAQRAADEHELRAAAALPGYDFDMLRFVREGEEAPIWRPASGHYGGWPASAANLTVLDPCCGSGHFLCEVLIILAGFRAQEEALSPPEAVAAVLRDNVFGLEIDGRCVQIAAFAVALTAWRVGGPQVLPTPHIAWVGAPPPLAKPEFEALADGDPDLERALAALHDLFQQAPLLGSLIEPTQGDLANPIRIANIERLITPLITKVKRSEPERLEGVVAARGMADAVSILSRNYTLQCTNVPYLGIGNQTSFMTEYIGRYFKDGRADLATSMIIRLIRLASRNGSIAVLAPQSWLFAGSYKKMRQRILSDKSFDFLCSLGARAFETISGEVVNVALVGITNSTPTDDHKFSGVDANLEINAAAKATSIATFPIQELDQLSQISNPDSRIAVAARSEVALLSEYADSYKGIATGDMGRFIFRFWEFASLSPTWEFLQEAPTISLEYTARSAVIRWEGGKGALLTFVQQRLGENGVGAWLRGGSAWGKKGIAVAQMSSLPATIYSGNLFDESTGVIIPKSESNLGAIQAFIQSDEYSMQIRAVDKSLKVPTLTLLKVPFDCERWKDVAAKIYENGIPAPISDDPTQWLFHGHPAKAEAGTQLHVALARLSGYRWPAEKDPQMRLSAEARGWLEKSAELPPADADGLLCLEAVAGEQPLAQRLRILLASAFGDAWSDALERRLVAEADQALDKKVARDGSLEAWLRDRAFRQHCRLFHDRPFLWQVWDGSPDGFSAFVQYHRLDAATLGKLTYTVLGDWIGRMANAGDARRIEAAKILQQKLAAILGGEAPLDIFVRWKPLEHQPVGWDPDIDDGVRLNIRPFVEAGVLRETPKIKWGVDRGSDTSSAPWFPHDKGKRDNDRHLTLADKQAARGAK